MTNIRILTGVAAILATASAPASAHYATVHPAGGDNCVVQHVGQFPPGHHSMKGHSTAASHEQSAVVAFGKPGTC